MVTRCVCAVWHSCMCYIIDLIYCNIYYLCLYFSHALLRTDHATTSRYTPLCATTIAKFCYVMHAVVQQVKCSTKGKYWTHAWKAEFGGGTENSVFVLLVIILATYIYFSLTCVSVVNVVDTITPGRV